MFSHQFHCLDKAVKNQLWGEGGVTQLEQQQGQDLGEGEMECCGQQTWLYTLSVEEWNFLGTPRQISNSSCPTTSVS